MATYSISGTVSPSALSGDGSGLVMANAPGGVYFQGQINSDGTYTIAGVTDATTYIVQASGAKFLTSIASHSVTVSGADVTGINFTAVAAAHIGEFTPIFSDSFQRANENPISDGGKWTSAFTPDVLQILNDVCCTTVTNQNDSDGASTYNGGNIPDNQYSSVKISNLTENGDFYTYVRADSTLDNTYAVFIYGGQGAGTSFGVFSIESGQSTYTWVGFQAWPFSNGDIISFGVSGSPSTGILYVFQNGTCIWQGALSPDPGGGLSSGTVGLQCDSLSTPTLSTDAELIDFTSGAFSIMASSNSANNNLMAGYGTDISAVAEFSSHPAGEINSSRTSIFGTNRGSRIIG